jgi:hypothetical protein
MYCSLDGEDMKEELALHQSYLRVGGNSDSGVTTVIAQPLHLKTSYMKCSVVGRGTPTHRSFHTDCVTSGQKYGRKMYSWLVLLNRSLELLSLNSGNFRELVLNYCCKAEAVVWGLRNWILE